MEDIQLIETVERYVRGEMSAEEKAYFEQLRTTNPELDQLVVEHTMFLNRLGEFGERKNYRAGLHEIHNQLLESGAIKEEAPKAVVRELWRKYKRVMAVAASIAGVTTLLIAGMVSYYSRKANSEELQQLKREFKNEAARNKNEVLRVVDNKINASKAPENTPIRSGGTGFLIDGKGYLVTNAHVVEGASSVVIQNKNGEEFRTNIVYSNPQTDIAILKIEDEDFKPVGNLPYAIRKTGAELGEQLFTLGYPRKEIVYNEGYMSAKTGFNGDTLSCQIGVSANPGNSGGPVFNKHGEVIGIINTREKQAEGVVFAITSKNIFRTLEEIKKEDTSTRAIKLSNKSLVRDLDRVQQVRKIEDFVFMVKSY